MNNKSVYEGRTDRMKVLADLINVPTIWNYSLGYPTATTTSQSPARAKAELLLMKMLDDELSRFDDRKEDK